MVDLLWKFWYELQNNMLPSNWYYLPKQHHCCDSNCREVSNQSKIRKQPAASIPDLKIWDWSRWVGGLAFLNFFTAIPVGFRLAANKTQDPHTCANSTSR
jgi:hypothetical protein